MCPPEEKGKLEQTQNHARLHLVYRVNLNSWEGRQGLTKSNGDERGTGWAFWDTGSSFVPLRK